jgi:hypothetical protein
MIETYAIIAVALLAAGVALGIVAIVSLGVRREQRRIRRAARTGSLTDAGSPGQAAIAARAFHGLYTRTAQVDYGGAHQRDNLRVLTGGGLPS